MKYYLPNWEDRVDPGYNFFTDEHSEAHTSNPKADSYVWEIFAKNELPLDGVLISRAALKAIKSSESAALESGIHQFLRLPAEVPVIADCGAWTYVKKPSRAPDPVGILSYYDKLGVDYGVTVDHLVLAGLESEKKKRMQDTYDNAIRAHEVWKKEYKDSFVLLASVQGWDENDYLKMFRNYLKRGLTHIAIGGLGKSLTPEVVSIIESIKEEIIENRTRPDLIHFFGLGRLGLLPHYAELEDLGVEVSFDTASWLRRAWMGGNYYSVVNDRLSSYTGIRIPQIGTERTGLKKNRKIEHEDVILSLQKLEKRAIDTLRNYRNVSPDSIMETLRDLDAGLVRSGSFSYNLLTDFEPLYPRTLRERPWEACDCPICSSVGIDVVIFRGNNRNRRRGFHNIYTMYHKVLKNKKTWRNGSSMEEARAYTSSDYLRSLDGRVLVLTSCSKLKSEAKVAPAKDLYKGRLFELTKRYCDMKGFPYYIISAKYALVRPDEVIETYDKVLRKEEDVKIIRPVLERELRSILPKYDKILVVAGGHYISALRNLIDSRFIFVRSKGYGHLCSIIAGSLPNQAPITQFLIGAT